MLANAVRITLRLMMFRSGPQDFPYSNQATQIVAPLAVLANFLQFRFTLPPTPALVQAVVSLATLVCAVMLLLQMRNLFNRAQQTCNALFATNCAFTLLLIPVLMPIAPVLQEIAANPDAMEQAQIPGVPMLMMFGLSIWNLGVTAHILRHALDLRPWLAVGLSISLAFFVFMVTGSVTHMMGA